MKDTHSVDNKLQRVVRKRRKGWLYGTSKMRVDDPKKWLKGAENKEQARVKCEEGFKGQATPIGFS
jgi:hypothetical protein